MVNGQGRRNRGAGGGFSPQNNYRFVNEQQEKHPLEMTAGELSKLQEEDNSLEAMRKAARGEVGTAGGGFFKWDGIIYRRWTPPGLDEGKASIKGREQVAKVGELRPLTVYCNNC